MKKYTTILTIAGSDSSGGAGIQADLKTFFALGCYGMSVITALTAQNTQGVTAVHAVPAKFVTQQLDAVFSDIEVSAIKIGMLHNIDIINAVAGGLKKFAADIPIVLDPVAIAKSGHTLLQNDAVASLVDKLFPLATVITPNLPEAELLLQRKITTYEDMQTAAQELCGEKLEAVLVKGGHLEQASDSSDCLYVKSADSLRWFRNKRIKTRNTHGTGCTLSSAIASFLALGYGLAAAVTRAEEYLHNAIAAGSKYKLGSGSGPVYHFI